MSEALSVLIEAAKKVRPSSALQEQQRRSFAYGNTAFENPLITREMVDAQADKLAKAVEDEGGTPSGDER